MKFHHMNSLLKRKAATTIRGLSASASTYGEAIKLLQNRYGQKDNAIASHMEKFYNLSAVKIMDIKNLGDIFNKMRTRFEDLRRWELELSNMTNY